MSQDTVRLVDYLSDIVVRPHSWTCDEYDALLEQFDDLTTNVKKFIESRKELVKSVVSHDVCSSFEYQGQRAYQEDRMLCCRSDYTKEGIITPFKIYAVFDGHRSVDVAAYLVEHFCEAISKHLSIYDNETEAIKAAFMYLDHQIFNENLIGGSTATGAILIGNTAHIFNLGDSRTVFFDESRTIVTRDHKPTVKQESDRIYKAGCTVVNGRIVVSGSKSPRPGGLAVSRGFGDIKYKINNGVFEPLLGAVTSLPDLITVELTNNNYIFSASDGFWDVFTSDDVVSMLSDDPNISINKLINRIKSNSNIRDNVSIVFTRLT